MIKVPVGNEVREFSAEEMSSIRNTTHMVCARIMMIVLMKYVKQFAAGQFDKEVGAITAELMALMPEKTMTMSMQVPAEDGGHIIHVALTSVSPDYKCVAYVPEKYARDLIREYMLMKTMTVTFWENWCRDNSALLGRIAAVLSPEHFEALSSFKAPDMNETQMFWHPDQDQRVGLYTYIMRGN